MKENTNKEQANISSESQLWEEISDEAAATCVGGRQFPGVNRKRVRRIFRRWQNYIDLIDSLG